MTIPEAVLLSAAAGAAGAMNAVAGGGTFLTFPALLFAGVPPVVANATSTLAVWPGSAASAFAYRHDVQVSRRLLLTEAAVSLCGGGIGAWLLLHTSNQAFEKIIPLLLVFASIVFTASPWLSKRLGGAEHGADPRGRTLAVSASIQLAIAIYGGYFGAGIGILMIAAWSALGIGTIHGVNGFRSILGTLVNTVALGMFIANHLVAWGPGLLMAASAVTSGYFGAAYARRLPPRMMRRIILGIAWTMTSYFCWKFYH